ncbi:MAG: hypothetical protein M3Y44_15205 [Actinomycetota bacterium]|nr:hypothetical protein [Actinomycetota bacterium]
MNRLTIAAAVAVTACAIGIPTVAALASGDSTNSRGPSHSRTVDDRSGPNRGSDDVTRSPAAVTSSAVTAPKDDRGTHVEPGDDRGTGVEPGDDNGTGVEPGDDNGTDAPGATSSTRIEPGDDNGTDAPGATSSSAATSDDKGGHDGSADDSAHHGHGG